MGKRSKMHKTGVPKAMLKKKELNNATLNSNAKVNQTRSANDSSDEDEVVNRQMNKTINQSVNYDPEILKKYGSLLGLNEKEMKSLAIKPIRNRRMVNNTVLSHRQKKKALRFEKKRRIEKMEQTTKLNLSMTYAKPFLNNTFALIGKKNEILVTHKNQLNLNDLQQEIKLLHTNEPNKSTSTSKIRTKRRNMKMLHEEKANIDSIIQKASFNQNPIEAMSLHIKTAQLVAERNKKIQDEYNKNYNMLNLK